jgi:hypothetical protein
MSEHMTQPSKTPRTAAQQERDNTLVSAGQRICEWRDLCQAVESELTTARSALAEEERELQDLIAQPKAAPQLPHGVCRADDPNSEAPSLPDGSGPRLTRQGTPAATPRNRERGDALSVSDDGHGTEIVVSAAPASGEGDVYLLVGVTDIERTRAEWKGRSHKERHAYIDAFCNQTVYALSLREREGMVMVPKLLMGQIATMLEYARCVTSDKDADTTFANLRDAVRELLSAPSAGGEEE